MANSQAGLPGRERSSGKTKAGKEALAMAEEVGHTRYRGEVSEPRDRT